MKSLIIDKRDKIKGLHTYCSKCKFLITNRKCGKTKKGISTCKFPESHKFKAIIGIPGNSPKKATRIINTRDIKEAIEQKMSFETELEENQYQPVEVLNSDNDVKPTLLVDCMALYISFLNNEEVEIYKQKARTEDYVKGVQRGLTYFCESLHSKGVDYMRVDISNLNEKMVGMFYDYLLNTKNNIGNATYNNYIATLRQFISWLINKRDYSIKNYFVDVRRRTVVLNNEIIEKDEFELLLSYVKPENSIKILSSGVRKGMYREWIKIAYRIALETGLRTEEFILIKFSDIIEKDGVPMFVEAENIKVNKAKGIVDSKQKQIKIIPITDNFREILKELNYEGNKNTNDYLIAQKSNVSRKTIKDKVSKSFTHFWNMTGVNKKLQLKNLRKTYLTSLANHFGEKATLISDHAIFSVLKNHYLNDKKMVEKAKGFSVFDKEV